MRRLIFGAAVLLLIGGCVNSAGERDPLAFAEAMRAVGVSGEVWGTIGDGHLAGQSFNFAGTHATFKIIVAPPAPPPADNPYVGD